MDLALAFLFALLAVFLGLVAVVFLLELLLALLAEPWRPEVAEPWRPEVAVAPVWAVEVVIVWGAVAGALVLAPPFLMALEATDFLVDLGLEALLLDFLWVDLEADLLASLAGILIFNFS